MHFLDLQQVDSWLNGCMHVRVSLHGLNSRVCLNITGVYSYNVSLNAICHCGIDKMMLE